jgi:uracil-DNA glycosylase
MTSAFEEGDPATARIAIVGEAPSYTEIRSDQPFVGPSGHLLNQLLQAGQIRRADCYITNVFETEVKKPKKDASKIFSQNDVLLWTAKKGFTEAGFEASRGCRERIARCAANVICTLGAPALHRFVDVRSISKWRGSIIEGSDGERKRKVVASFHPSYALQGAYEARYIIAADFKRVKAESVEPAIRYDVRELRIDPSFDECMSFLRRALDAPAINTDIELLNGSVDCFSIALSPTEAITIPLLDVGFDHRWTADEERQIWQGYAALIAAPHITKINQNIAFDLAVLLQLNRILPAGPIADCMVAFSVMNPFLKKSLGLISSLYTREPYYKDDGELHDSVGIDDFKRRWLYCAKDSVVSLESWQKLDRELDEKGYRSTYDMTMNLVPSLIWMMVRGLRVNSPALLKTKHDTQEKIAALMARMAESFGRPIINRAPKTAAEKRAVAASGAININSQKQLCAYFYEEKKLRPYIGDSGAQTCDDLALSRIIRRDGLHEAKLLQDYRTLNTLLTRYLDINFDADGRVRCSWNPRGTWTGRLSSSQTVFDTGGNLQNLPYDVRTFMESDYADA